MTKENPQKPESNDKLPHQNNLLSRFKSIDLNDEITNQIIAAKYEQYKTKFNPPITKEQFTQQVRARLKSRQSQITTISYTSQETPKTLPITPKFPKTRPKFNPFLNPTKPTPNIFSKPIEESTLETKTAPAKSTETLENKENDLNLPERSPDAPSGTEFFKNQLGVSPETVYKIDSKGNIQITQGIYNNGITGEKRAKLLLEQIQKGNVPTWARKFQTVKINKNGIEVELKVLPRYLAIGNDQDYVEIPMSAKLAKQISDLTGTAIPTKEIEQAIYEQANIKTSARPLSNRPNFQNYMQGNGFVLANNALNQTQISQAKPTDIIAGHKKIIIASPESVKKPDRMDFYGFMHNGKAIQGAHGLPHENTYDDYSQGLRLINPNLTYKITSGPDAGKTGTISYQEALQNPTFAKILADSRTFNPTKSYTTTNT